MIDKIIKTLNEVNEKLSEEEFYYNEFKKDKQEMIDYYKNVDPKLVPLKEEEISKQYEELDNYYNTNIYPLKIALKEAEDELLDYAQANYKHQDLTDSFWNTVRKNVVKRNQVIYGLLVDKFNGLNNILN
nr:hypothetical protein [Methanobrevibacter arboriphilus]